MHMVVGVDDADVLANVWREVHVRANDGGAEILETSKVSSE